MRLHPAVIQFAFIAGFDFEISRRMQFAIHRIRKSLNSPLPDFAWHANISAAHRFSRAVIARANVASDDPQPTPSLALGVFGDASQI